MIAPVYVLTDGEMLISSPLPVVWATLRDYPSWQKMSLFRRVSGAPGEEGEVVLMKKEGPGFQFPSYYARTIKLDPPRRVIYKTYPEEKRLGDDFFGIVDFTLSKEGQETRFIYRVLYEFEVTYDNESQLHSFETERCEDFTRLQSDIFAAMKRLAEQAHRT